METNNMGKLPPNKFDTFTSFLYVRWTVFHVMIFFRVCLWKKIRSNTGGAKNVQIPSHQKEVGLKNKGNIEVDGYHN